MAQVINILRKILRLILFGHILIAGAASLLSYHTIDLLQTGMPSLYLLLVFFSTLAVYSLHSIIRPEGQGIRSEWLSNNKPFLRIQSIISLAAIILLLINEPILLKQLLLPGLAAMIYSLPRLIGIRHSISRGILYFKTIYLALVWLLVTTWIPLSYQLTGMNTGIACMVLSKFILLFQVCMLFEQKDKEFNRSKNWKVWVNEWKPEHFRLAMKTSTLTGLLALLIAGFSGLSPLAVWSLAIPVLILSVTPSPGSEIGYYGWIDGMLLVPGLMALLFN